MRFKSHRLAPKSAADLAFLLHGFHYHLNISRYISTAVGEEDIDLETNFAVLRETVKAVRTATLKHNEFFKELGLPLLPLGDSARGE